MTRYIQPARSTESPSARTRGAGATQGGDCTTSTLSRPPVLRPGATDHLQHPSRFGNTLHHPDGRTTDTDHGDTAQA